MATVQAATADPLFPDERGCWWTISIRLASDMVPSEGQIDPATRPLGPAGLGAVPGAMDRLQPGDVLAIAAGGDSTIAMIRVVE